MKPFTTHELEQLSRILIALEQGAIIDYGNTSGKFAHAKLIDADDDKLVIELRSGIQSDCYDTVHSDIAIASRKQLGVIIRVFEEEVV
jgi:hypothetical protein